MTDPVINFRSSQYKKLLLLKEWKCVLVGHHNSVGKVIEKWEKAGWRLHTYACAGNAAVALGTNHYLLFEIKRALF